MITDHSTTYLIPMRFGVVCPNLQGMKAFTGN